MNQDWATPGPLSPHRPAPGGATAPGQRGKAGWGFFFTQKWWEHGEYPCDNGGEIPNPSAIHMESHGQWWENAG